MNNLVLQRAMVTLQTNNGEIQFNVIHNLPNIKGLCLDDAVMSWSARTTKYTAFSLCRYIMNKNTEYVAMTEYQYKKLQKLGT